MTAQEELIEQLSRVGRDAVDRGLVAGSGGNLSARVPGSDVFLVTCTGSWLDRLTATDFATVDLVSGEPWEGAIPSSEYRVHLRAYQRRPDAQAIVHLHQQMTVLVDAMDLPIRPLSLDQAHYLRRIGRAGFFPNGSWGLGDAVGDAAESSNAIVLAHHGAVTLGEDIDMAYRRALNLEEAATATFKLHLAGRNDVEFPADIELPSQERAI